MNLDKKHLTVHQVTDIH